MVELKSYKKGIQIRLEPEGSFEEVREAVAGKFKEASDFFGDSEIAVTFFGRELSRDEEFELVKVIEENSRLRIRCILGVDEETERLYDCALEKVEAERLMRPFLTADIRQGSVKPGEKVTSKRSLVILGDAEKGSDINAFGDIYCLGTLSGSISAGLDMQPGHRVIALSFSPQHLDISGINYIPGKEQGGVLGFGKQKGAKIAKVGPGNKVILSPLTKQMLENTGVKG